MTLPKRENGSRTASHSPYIQNIQAQMRNDRIVDIS